MIDFSSAFRASGATRYESEIGAAMLASLRPQAVVIVPPPRVVETPEPVINRMLVILRGLPGREGTISDILSSIPEMKVGQARRVLGDAKRAGLVTLEDRSSVGVWRPVEGRG